MEPHKAEIKKFNKIKFVLLEKIYLDNMNHNKSEKT